MEEEIAPEEAAPPFVRYGESIYVHDRNGRLRYTIDFPAPPGIEDVLAERGEFALIGPTGMSLHEGVALGGFVWKRPAMPISWKNGLRSIVIGHSAITLLGPSGAQVFVDGDPAGRIEDGEFVIEATTPGLYAVRVSHWPFLEAHTDFTAS